MKKILIADSSKASLVMTSEVFKDHYPGIQVLVARNSAEAISLAKSSENIDAFIVDFDLPDTNGAQTALLLKKMSKTPILITAFDDFNSIQTIETLLTKYADCKSWLKKPVNPEVVIAVAQRYCDGKIRAQKRISCQLPVLAKIEIQKSVKKVKATTTAAATKEKSEVMSLCFHGIIEDCSLNGIKLKPSKHIQNASAEWAQLFENIESISAGSPITVEVPSFFDIEIGKIEEVPKTNKTKNLKNKKVEKEVTHELGGKVVWTNAETGEWCMGIEFENQALSKRLFEAVVSLQSRQHKATQKQSIMKASRAS
ncbi:MAG: response regulator [Bdellovibrionota bacterium]